MAGSRSGIAGVLLLLAAGGNSNAPAQEGTASLADALARFRRWREPNPNMVGPARRLRNRFLAELGSWRPRGREDLVYCASFPYYVMALEAMDEAILAAFDHANAPDRNGRLGALLRYRVCREQLRILEEAVARVPSELGP